MVAKRRQFGHWKCALIQFRKKFGKAYLTSLVEQVSRLTVLLRNNDRLSRPVMDGVIRVLQPLPQMARRSITFDRGSEFTEWAYLQTGLGAQTLFCDPQSPWQKGTVENTNRLNNTPRKCLGYKTPAEVFRQKSSLTVTVMRKLRSQKSRFSINSHDLMARILSS